MKRVCMALIRFYQRALSPCKRYPTCRFTPSCSAYALEAFEKRGFFAGFVLMLWRLLRCSPLSPGGYDPVPEAGFHTMPLRWSKYDRPRKENPPQGEMADHEVAGHEMSDDEMVLEDTPPTDASPADNGAPPASQPKAHQESNDQGNQRPGSEEPHP